MSLDRMIWTGKNRTWVGRLGALPLAALLCCIGCETCPYSNDGECDDGRPCAVTALCAFGTDEADCSNIGACDPANSCVYADDGECDDGRPGSVTSLCDFGTDFNDCGP